MEVIINAVIIGFVAVALLVTAHYLKRINQTYDGLIFSLDDVSRRLESIKGKNPVTQCESIFNAYPNLQSTWEKYRRKIDADGKYASAHSKEFFSRDKLIAINTKNADRIKALPGLLTAWGLLGTFIAILLGLTGIDPNNIATISNLVHGLYAKFTSSIVALGCSIFFVFQERGKYSQLSIHCENFQQTMEEIFNTISTNDILSRIETNIENNSTIIIGVLNNIGASVEKQSNSMKDLSKNLTKNSLEALEEMVDVFKDSLIEGADEQFRSIQDIIENLTTLIGDIEDTHSDYLETLERINTGAEEIASHHDETLDRIEQMSNNLAENIELFNTAHEKGKEYLDSLLNKIGEISYAGEQFAAAAPSLDQQKDSILELSNKLKEAIDYFNNVTNEITSSKLDELIGQFNEGIRNSLNEIQSGLEENYRWQGKQLDKLVESTTANVDSINSAMSSYTEKTSDFLEGYDKSIARAFNNFQILDTKMKDNIKQLDNNFSDLNKTLKSINEKVGSEV